MVPRKPLAFWQKSAQPLRDLVLPFESRARRPHLNRRTMVRRPAVLFRLDCYPSLPLGPDLSWVGPLLYETCAEPCQSANSAFAKWSETADSAIIRNQNRGSSTCINPSPHWPSSPPSSCRAAWKAGSIPTARLLVPSAVLPLVPLPITTSRKAPLPAACSVSLPVIGATAARPLTPPRLPHGRVLSSKAIRALPRVAFLFAPAPAEGRAHGGKP